MSLESRSVVDKNLVFEFGDWVMLRLGGNLKLYKKSFDESLNLTKGCLENCG